MEEGKGIHVEYEPGTLPAAGQQGQRLPDRPRRRSRRSAPSAACTASRSRTRRCRRAWGRSRTTRREKLLPTDRAIVDGAAHAPRGGDGPGAGRRAAGARGRPSSACAPPACCSTRDAKPQEWAKAASRRRPDAAGVFDLIEQQDARITMPVLRLCRRDLLRPCSPLAAPVAAQEWSPTKPVRIIVPMPAARTTSLARIVQPSCRRRSASR